MAGLLPVDEALRRILASAQKLEAETVPLGAAGGRVLATDLYAKRQQPPFAASAMDGYAVKAADVATCAGHVETDRPIGSRACVFRYYECR